MKNIAQNRQLLGRIETSLAKAVAEMHFVLKAFRKFENPSILQKMQKQYDELVAIGQEISAILDEASKVESEKDQPFNIDEFVQINKPYNSYHGYLGKVIEVDGKEKKVTVAFPGINQPKTFPFDHCSKAWTVPPTSRLMMKA